MVTAVVIAESRILGVRIVCYFARALLSFDDFLFGTQRAYDIGLSARNIY